MNTSKEWGMVEELMAIKDEIENDNRADFVQELYDNLDPYLPFLEQMNQRQKDYLYSIYDFYVNEDTEAFEGWIE